MELVESMLYVFIYMIRDAWSIVDHGRLMMCEWGLLENRSRMSNTFSLGCCAQGDDVSCARTAYTIYHPTKIPITDKVAWPRLNTISYIRIVSWGV